MTSPVLAVLALAAPAGVATPLAVTAGPHPVGVRSIEPATVVWYPAERRGPSAPVTYRDYVRLALRDTAPGPDGKARTLETTRAFLKETLE